MKIRIKRGNSGLGQEWIRNHLALKRKNDLIFIMNQKFTNTKKATTWGGCSFLNCLRVFDVG